MRIAVVREALATDPLPLETRVAATPDSVRKLKALGFDVAVETGAGLPANFADSAYVEAGATIASDIPAHYAAADILLKLRPLRQRDDLGAHEVDLVRESATVLGYFYPARNPELLERARARNLTVVAMECIPRISRAQKMDALSSQANIAGYRAVLEAANRFGSFSASRPASRLPSTLPTAFKVGDTGAQSAPPTSASTTGTACAMAIRPPAAPKK